MSIKSDIHAEIYPLHQLVKLNHFWESTGLCPPLPHQNASDFLLSNDMIQNLLLIASVPHGGIKQVRIHWLLELITYGADKYNFQNLDELIAILHKNRLRPGFEIMGNPSKMFSNFDNMTQVYELLNLVATLADRYVTIYGLGYVSKWNFETWNEPDHEDFDNVSMSVEGFLKYYDACSEGLMRVDRALTYGGPGGSCRSETFSKRCWALLQHCSNGTNYITGKNGSRIDYISFHKKGGGTSSLILDQELQTIAKIQSNYPKLAATPIYNDEADPLVGWSKPQWWRADATYASIIAKVICQHQNKIIANESISHINFALLSNDNGFLSFSPHFFTQRTLNARFQVNNTNPRYVHLVKKPSLTVMGLLSKLGNIQVKMDMHGSDMTGGITSLCTAESCQEFEMSTLFYNSADTEPVVGESRLQLTYHNLKTAVSMYYKGSVPDLRMVMCTIDNARTNPYAVWKSMGNPTFPTAQQFLRLHEAEGPFCHEPKTVAFDKDGSFQSQFDLLLPGVALQQICAKFANFTGKPSNLQIFPITQDQVLISWDDAEIETKCISTYVVQYSNISQPYNFTTINKSKLLFTSYTYITTACFYGVYRVKAIDFWGRSSSFSNPLTFLK